MYISIVTAMLKTILFQNKMVFCRFLKIHESTFWHAQISE